MGSAAARLEPERRTSHTTRMPDPGPLALAIGGALSAIAALAHLACIAIGAPAYRFMGAGERMARAAELGKLEPTLVTLGISILLAVWAAFAFSGAGWAPRLPLLKPALSAITAAYLLRAVAFPLLTRVFPGNSTSFWLISSGICLAMGSVHLVGLVASWPKL